jgi:hypothetical protein
MPLDAPQSGAVDQTAPASSPVQPAGRSVANALASNREPEAPEKSHFRRWFSRRVADPNAIRDMRFMSQVGTLTSLKTFLLTEAIEIRAEDAPLISFGVLYQLRYSDDGRLPTLEEWELLDGRSQKLFSYLEDDEIRRRFQLKQTANLIAGLPVALIIAALASLMIATFIVDRNLLLLCYFFWTICLGAIGAIAFLSVNALSIQKDVTFDLTNKSLLAVRIVLGSLFGVVLSIPVGFDSFVTFCESLAFGGSKVGAANNVVSFSLQAVLLLLPFILGFSTSLVILVMNRFVESIAVFFGDRRGSDG